MNPTLWIGRIPIALTFAAILTRTNAGALITEHFNEFRFITPNIIKHSFRQIRIRSTEININSELTINPKFQTVPDVYVNIFSWTKKQRKHVKKNTMTSITSPFLDFSTISDVKKMRAQYLVKYRRLNKTTKLTWKKTERNIIYPPDPC